MHKKPIENFFILFLVCIRKNQKNKERVQKKACERYQKLSEEEENKKRNYGHERYRNLPEEERNKQRQYGREQHRYLPKDEKQRLVEHRKIFSRM